MYRLLVFAVILVLPGVSGCTPPYEPGREGWAEADAVRGHLLENHRFTSESQTLLGEPAVYAMPQRDFVRIAIYEVTSLGEQETILDLLRDGRRRHSWRALRVEFYREEAFVWRPLQERGDEVLLKAVTLEAE